MLKEAITYTDYNGTTRTEDFYFNLKKSEVIELELSVDGGMSSLITNIVNTNDLPKLSEYFKNIILKSYGVKSQDGKRFMKSEQLSKAFYETEAYSELYVSLITDANKAAKFVNKILPPEYVNKDNPRDKVENIEDIANAMDSISKWEPADDATDNYTENGSI